VVERRQGGMASRRPPPALTAKEERIVLNLLQQGKSNLAVLNHYSTQDMELVLEQVGPAFAPTCGARRRGARDASERLRAPAAEKGCALQVPTRACLAAAMPGALRCAPGASPLFKTSVAAAQRRLLVWSRHSGDLMCERRVKSALKCMHASVRPCGGRCKEYESWRGSKVHARPCPRRQRKSAPSCTLRKALWKVCDNQWPAKGKENRSVI
jgi:hypothetical protein